MNVAMEIVTSKRWEVIFNPNAFGNRREAKWAILQKQLSNLAIDYQHYIVTSNLYCNELVRRLCNEGKRHFMIVGGDGTLNDSLNAIFTANIDTTEVFLWVIPIGTGNDWSRTHCYSHSFAYELANYKQGNFVLHDVGVVTCSNRESTIDKRFFINMAGFGFDGAVIYSIANRKSPIMSSLIYLMGVLKVLFSYRSVPTIITYDEKQIENKLFTMVVGIGQYNGNGMRQAPTANPQDGWFDVVVIRNISKFKVIRNIKRLYAGTHTTLKEVTQFRTKSLTIHSNFTFRGEVEGEVLPLGDYKIEILEKKINVLTFNDNFH